MANEYVKFTDYPTASVAGVVRPHNYYGTAMTGSNGIIAVYPALAVDIKAGVTPYRPISSATQHAAAFYGLAKAAGDTTQSQSDNAVGTYTENAKSAISEMLDGSVAVSGTTPTIVAKSGIRYVCGEVSTLDFTPSASGICDVRFESGSTPTALTVPNTVKFPAWFDPTNLTPNTVLPVL